MARSGHARPGEGREDLMDLVAQASNLTEAIRRVKKNKGSPGVDGMTVEQMECWMQTHQERLRAELLSGRYRPTPVKRCEIPKRGGGVRELGIPTAIDRVVQQAMLQVLQPRIDPTFSEHSYGFRPGRSAHQAVRQALQFVQEGRDIVVDVDLSKFFDRVQHDVLMRLVAVRIRDHRVLSLIGRFLRAGIMVHGVVVERHEGTPQGGPLSPLLANVMLDEVDRELTRRGHRFCRYADDCNVYVRSRSAGERVMASLRAIYERLRLKVNEEKSAVATVYERQFLGFTFFRDRRGEVGIAVAPTKAAQLKERLRELTPRSGGRSMETVLKDVAQYLKGWRNYFGVARGRMVLLPVEQWLRRRLRMLHLKAWRRGPNVFRNLIARGAGARIAAEAAAHGRSRWRTAKHPAVHMALPNRFFHSLGIGLLA